jgi:ubiquinone/menaquinone biosynthesis C-methylase UbiE
LVLEGWKARAGLAVGRQLSHPSGLGGRITAAVMRVANRLPSHAVIEALDIQPSDTVLDIGCGDGSMIAAMQPAAHTCGIDPSVTMIDAARVRNRAAVASGRVSLLHGDMMALPFEPNSFDKIAASNVLYFCPDVPALIHECRRVATSGALLVIYVTAAESMRHWRFASRATHRHFSPLELEQQLGRAGVRSEDISIDRLSLPGGIEGLVARVVLKPREHKGQAAPAAAPD